ncbi:hypothetical protein Despr_0243 [Desulfobulbus propionicus DSM 2032]|uniref:DUF4424 domain-containing protein n=1 Tax=Desulfobulbus propionicus (strain ATCC 33891 / DSM 2032 / VKM B-1956 / 1pr3) TaxID=577650 RepID=A0A7U3YJA2_DESPD|nr:DUF4424 family protein [Desulfobulbus propionicus]ADW16430.1 hypothetical protein Despr_0243 [Desulfobulbus propionicus DSM 2032]
MKHLIRLLLCCLLLAPAICRANDGFGGLSATGLHFHKNASVRMLAEDLFLSPGQVRVRSVFRNEGAMDVQGEVIFPLPPISLAALTDSGFALSEQQLARENVVDFIASVNGQRIPVQSDRIAVREPHFEAQRPLSAGYDTPGEDVTAVLKELGIPLSLNVTEVAAMIARLPQPSKDRLRAGKLADFFDGEPPRPAWSIIVRYHWPQVFPAGREITIDHRYAPAPPGGIFSWPKQERDLDPYQRELIQTYCIDDTTRKGLVKRLHHASAGELAGTGTALFLDYVLTTANTWHGPIGTFRLTIDKGSPDNILSLCMDGIRKTGPTTFVVEKTNFTPTEDLRLLIVSRLAQ